MGAVVDDQVLYGGKHLIDGFHSDVCDYAWVLDHISQAVLHQLTVAHFT